MRLHRFLTLMLFLSLSSSVQGQDWSNYGANAQRNGQAGVTGPTQALLHWDNPDNYDFVVVPQPVIEDGRALTIRHKGLPVHGGSSNDLLVCYDLETGTKLWERVPPWSGSTTIEGYAVIGGAGDGKVYVSRSEAFKPGPIYAFDVNDGRLLWTSSARTEGAFLEGGAVTIPLSGDLLVGDLRAVYRIDHRTGAEVWRYPRSKCGHGGVAANGHDVYLVEDIGGGRRILTKLDADTGAKRYSSPSFSEDFVSPPVMHPVCCRVFVPGMDNLYGFSDAGSHFTIDWSRPIRSAFGSMHAMDIQGTIYALSPADELLRIDPATGGTVAKTAPLSPIDPRAVPTFMAFGTNNIVYVSNGDSNGTDNGRIWAYSFDLNQHLFTLTLDQPGAGGPTLGPRGTLVVADRDGVRAYRTLCSPIRVWVEGAGGGPPAAGGRNTAFVECATPFNLVLVALSANPVGFTPTSTCGLNWSMARAKETQIPTDADGRAQLSRVAPLRLLGRQIVVQALDVKTCSLSSVHVAQF